MKAYASGLLAALAVCAAPASAGVFYQSIPDLTVAPSIPQGLCSTCSGSQDQWIGEAITLGSAHTVRSVTFTVVTGGALPQAWPVPVTLGFYKNTFVVGPNLYEKTFSTFATEIAPTPDYSVLTVNLGGSGLALTTGNYLLFVTNPTGLYVPPYSNLGGAHGVYVTGALAGGIYQPLGSGRDIAVALSDTTVVPEAATWAMMAIGFAALAGAAWRGKRHSEAVVA